MLDGIERHAHPTVTDGVDVDLEAVGVERSDRFGEAFRAPVGEPAAVRRVLVRLEKETSASFDHTVGEELDRAGGERASGRGLD